MSRTIKGSKAAGYDYWSRRPYSGCGHGADIKRICHGIERAQEKAIIVKESEEAMDYESHNAFWRDTGAH